MLDWRLTLYLKDEPVALFNLHQYKGVTDEKPLPCPTYSPAAEIVWDHRRENRGNGPTASAEPPRQANCGPTGAARAAAAGLIAPQRAQHSRIQGFVGIMRLKGVFFKAKNVEQLQARRRADTVRKAAPSSHAA